MCRKFGGTGADEFLLLSPNGWMHQDATRYGGRPQPSGLCVRWRPSPPPQKGGGVPPIFGSCLLWPNGWMHQDATWYGARPQPRGLCVRWMGTQTPLQIFSPRLLWPNGWMDQNRTWHGGKPTSPKGGGAPPQFSAHVYCGQTAGWINMALGMEVGLLSLIHI